MTLVPPNKSIAEGRLQPKLIRFPGAMRHDGKQTSLAKPGAASVNPRRLSKIKIVLGKIGMQFLDPMMLYINST